MDLRTAALCAVVESYIGSDQCGLHGNGRRGADTDEKRKERTETHGAERNEGSGRNEGNGQTRMGTETDRDDVREEEQRAAFDGLRKQSPSNETMAGLWMRRDGTERQEPPKSRRNGQRQAG